MDGLLNRPTGHRPRGPGGQEPKPPFEEAVNIYRDKTATERCKTTKKRHKITTERHKTTKRRKTDHKDGSLNL